MSAEDAACNKITELALNDREVGCMLLSAAAPIHTMFCCHVGMACHFGGGLKRVKPETPAWHR